VLAPTHLIAGQTAYLGACIGAGLAPDPAHGLVAAAAGLLPDIDRRASLPGRALPFLSEPLEYWVGHRTLTHSAMFLCALGAVLWPVLPGGWWWAFFAGVASHQFLDWITPRGTAWFWPSTARAVLPGSPRFRPQPMSWAEFSVAVTLAVSAFPLLWLAQIGHGSGGVITAAIADIREARHQYDAQRGRNAWELEIEGTANQTAADVSGRYDVRGPWRAGGFIVDTAEGPRSVCAGANCDWYADRAVLHRGPSRVTTSRRIQAATIEFRELRTALEPLQQAGEVLLVGEVRARGVSPEPPIVRATAGGVIELRYARLAELHSWPARMREVDLIAQVRHEADVNVPEIEPGGYAEPSLSPRLRRWVE